MQYECKIYWLWEELPVLCPDYTRVVVRDISRQAAGLSEAGMQQNMQCLWHENSSLVRASEKN
jgi:hypothetical protein